MNYLESSSRDDVPRSDGVLMHSDEYRPGGPVEDGVAGQLETPTTHTPIPATVPGLAGSVVLQPLKGNLGESVTAAKPMEEGPARLEIQRFVGCSEDNSASVVARNSEAPPAGTTVAKGELILEGSVIASDSTPERPSYAASRTLSTISVNGDSDCNIANTMRALKLEKPTSTGLANTELRVPMAGSALDLPRGREDSFAVQPDDLSPHMKGQSTFDLSRAHTAERPNWALAPDEAKVPKPRNGFKRNMKSTIPHLPQLRNLPHRRGQEPDWTSSRVLGHNIPIRTAQISCSGHQDSRQLTSAVDWPSWNFRPFEHASERLPSSGPLPTQIDSRPSQITSMVWTDPLTVSSSSYGMEAVSASRSPAPPRHLGNQNPMFASVGNHGGPGRGHPSGGQSVMGPIARLSGNSVPVIVNSWSDDPRYGQYAGPPHLILRPGASEVRATGQQNPAPSTRGSQWQLRYASETIQGDSSLGQHPRPQSSGTSDQPARAQGYGQFHTPQDPLVPYSRDAHPQRMHTEQPQTSHRKDMNRGVSREHTTRFPAVREGFPNMSHANGVSQGNLARILHEESASRFQTHYWRLGQSTSMSSVPASTLWRT